MKRTVVTYLQPAKDPFSVLVSETSQVGEARRLCKTLGRAIGMNEVACGQVAIVATELASNLARHAKGGELIARSMQECDGATTTKCGLEILTIDRGPGLASIGAAMHDGFSTGGTAGTGLGAVRRLATEMDLFTQPGRGTAIVARFWATAGDPCEPPKGRPMHIGAITVPVAGEEACGDSWFAVVEDDGRSLFLIADGLGHGLLAAKASQAAVRSFRENQHLPTPRIIEAIHAALRSTRGAAVAVAEIVANGTQMNFTGVGNIVASIVDGDRSRSMVSHSGTAGAEARRIQEFVYPLSPDSIIIMHSDGLTSHGHLPQYPGLRFRHPSLIAAMLYRDQRRARDDATVLVVRQNRQPSAAPGVKETAS